MAVLFGRYMTAKDRPIKVGLEIHQQLATHKLFCNCESRLVDEVNREFIRRLRPTQSELGEVDRAALEEAAKDLVFRYQATDTSCLVEADEEPPHEANREAVETVLTAALMLGADPVDEIHFMRKIVIDGSNTTGFQRSALVAMNGSLDVGGKTIGIPSICLEEDAARLIGREEREVIYRLDRLGIPLVEVATTPDIDSPEMARDAALKIGQLLRATRRVMRGLGTIREDLNVSVEGGARVEIKGVQDLRMVSTIVEKEVDRQVKLLEASRILGERGVTELKASPEDLTKLLEGTPSKVLRQARREGGVILGLRLKGFAGLLEDRLGPEMAAQVAVVGVRGLLHSDELPAYGLQQGEVDAVASALDCGAQDAFLLVADQEAKALKAMERSRMRALAALEGVPEETRDAKPDGHTVYSRPLPGSARMYPETDVAPIRVSNGWLNRLSKRLPEPLEKTMERLSEEYGLHYQQAKQLVDDGWDDLFERLAGQYGNPRVVARTFLNHLPELKAEGVDVARIQDELFEDLFSTLARDRFAKEAIPTILRSTLQEGMSVEDVLRGLKLKRLSKKDLARELDRILDEHAGLLRERGHEAVKALMGVAMDRLRGRAEGKVISEVLTSKLDERLREL